ncbi:cdc42 effector protein 5 [Carassius gibelio]|uniref:cdc42 effector protein 5 n=1 Tax=Carassius gibelio TaxID=101364 RepID=UPI0022777634|nr:cdc42 effector protein 5 [Carassius gibelio]XP_052434352.1 cdc42 effector protein 5 [Carassius gibelio]XP_052434354.1 cdc42 effector protein 5 [Carassius gibelio]XP_052434355.1 cdc42 effector protein 5 [Carassius gibelio]
MPLHKSSSRTPRLDPTMISAPLGDFRHTMHIGRGGDAFGDTSFLSSHGPSSPNPTSVQQPAMGATVDTTDNQMNHNNEIEYAEDTGPNELRHSDSVSSFDLDLDLGPSILGDVLGVMDGLTMGSHKDNEDVFSPSRSSRDVMMSPRNAANELNERMRMESMTTEGSHRDEQLNEVNGVKSKGLRPKVRFSDKRDEIIGRQEVIEGLDVEVEVEMGLRPNKGMQETQDPRQAEVVNQKEDNSPSLSSSVSSEYEGVSPLDRRREDQHLSETDSEEEGANGQQGYTFEDEFDDEIGL